MKIELKHFESKEILGSLEQHNIIPRKGEYVKIDDINYEVIKVIHENSNITLIVEIVHFSDSENIEVEWD